MKKILSKRNIIYYFFTIMISFFIGYFLITSINTFSSQYECKFETNELLTQENLITLDNLDKAKASNTNHSNIDIDNLLYKDGITLSQIDEKTYTITTYTRFYDSFFLKDKKIISTRAKTFIKSLLNETSNEITYLYPDTLITINYTNPFLGGLISVLIILPISILLKNKILKDNNSINQINSIFSATYWKDAKSFLSSPKKITTLAMIFALLLASKMIKIPSGFSNLGISFGFIFLSIIGIIYGPLAGLLIGILSDILGFFLFTSTGSFFIGYVFQAMISGFLHAIFLYKRKITYIQILLMRLTISIICNVIIGSICWGIVANYTFSQTLSYMLIFVIPKNIVYLFPQSIILFLILKSILPILSKFKYIDEEISTKVTIY